MKFWRKLTASTANHAAMCALDAAPRTTLAAWPEEVVHCAIGIVAALDDTVLAAPYSKRPCLAWSATADGDTTERRVASCAFAVVDPASGRRAIAMPHDLHPLLAISHWSDETTVRIDLGLPWVHRAGAKRYNRCTEGILCAGDRVALVGAGLREPDPDAGELDYREVATLYRILRGAIVTNDPVWIDR